MDLSAVPVTPMDIFFTAILIIAIFRCVIRGFVREFMSAAAFIGGIITAIFFSAQGAEFVALRLGLVRGSRIIAFITIFIVIYLVIKILEGIIQRLLEKLHLEKLDRALGFFLGIVEGVLLIMLIIFILQIQPFFDTSELLRESFIAGLIFRYLPDGIQYLKSRV